MQILNSLKLDWINFKAVTINLRFEALGISARVHSICKTITKIMIQKKLTTGAWLQKMR